MARFKSLPEDRKYSITVQILYNGGFEQDSLQSVNASMCMRDVLMFSHGRVYYILGTFDVQKVNVSIKEGKVCFRVDC